MQPAKISPGLTQSIRIENTGVRCDTVVVDSSAREPLNGLPRIRRPASVARYKLSLKFQSVLIAFSFFSSSLSLLLSLFSPFP